MREILYRGKRVDNGEFVYGYYIKATYHWHEKGIHKDWIVCGASQNGGWFTIQNRYAVIPETVGQFTGLTDKNEKKIFEGDILCDDECIGKINYDGSSYTYEWKLRRYLKSDFYRNCILSDFARLGNLEVIGDIHDNPELLGGE